VSFGIKGHAAPLLLNQLLLAEGHHQKMRVSRDGSPWQ
jgi:hypothetical protein